jgi:PAS domain S-box-containing protein
MYNTLKSLLTPPALYISENEQRRARILFSVLRSLFFIMAVFIAATPFIFAKKLESASLFSSVGVFLVIALYLARTGKLRASIITLVSGSWIIITITVYFAGGMQNVDVIYYASVTVMSGLLLGRRAANIVAVSSVLAGMAMVLLYQNNVRPPIIFPVPPWAGLLNMSIGLFIISSSLNLALQGLSEALARSQRELSERTRTENALRESEARATAILDAIPDMMFLLSRNGIIIDYAINYDEQPQARQLALHGKTLGEFLPARLAQRAMTQAGETLAKKKMNIHEYRLPVFGRGIRHYEARMVPMGPDGVMAIVRDITESRKAEERIRRSLHEKEILLKEIHHRVKNNMQIISSFISLQMQYLPEGTQREMFLEIQTRVRAMSLVHEKLYQSSDLAEINLRDYLSSLKDYIWNSYSDRKDRASIVSDIDDITIDLDRAIPTGLIVNELLTNAIKYAFPGDRTGRIVLSCKKSEGGRILLSVSDDGIGIPEYADLSEVPTLGLQIVNALTQQIRGSISVQRSGGTTFSILF